MDKYRCIECRHIYDKNGINGCKWLKEQQNISLLNIKELAEWWNNSYKFEKGAEKYCKGFTK